jgi:hypothetical protein
VSRSSQRGGLAPRRVDPVLVGVLGSLVGLLGVFWAALDVGSTALVVGIAGMVGAVVAAREGRRRKYHTITDAGLAALAEHKRQWGTVARALSDAWGDGDLLPTFRTA